jgi:hypothetical protein
MLLAWVATIVVIPLCLFWEQDVLYPFSVYIIRQLLCLIERGREASTGWVRGLLSGHLCEEVEGGA